MGFGFLPASEFEELSVDVSDAELGRAVREAFARTVVGPEPKPPKPVRLPKAHKEGDFVWVPLADGRHVVGRIARCERKILVTYFFGPARTDEPESDELLALAPEDAVLISRHVDDGIRTGVWRVLVRPDRARWNKERWRWLVPAFTFLDPIKGGQHYRVTYDDDHPARPALAIEPISASEARLLDGEFRLPGVLEGELSRRLGAVKL